MFLTLASAEAHADGDRVFERLDRGSREMQQPPAAGDRWALLLSGISGDASLKNAYFGQLMELRSILVETFGFESDKVTLLFEDPALAPQHIRGKSSREDLEQSCRALADRARGTDLVFVFITGHGSFDRGTYKLNLVGPDITGDDLAALIYSIPAARFVVVNSTSASGGSIPALTHPGAVLVTATKSGNEKNRTYAGQYFIEALKDNQADVDKDGRVSILEAFNYAAARVADHYERDGHLQTEHPVLEDDGDGQAQAEPGPSNGEGLVARITYLDLPSLGSTGPALSDEERQLRNEIETLQRQIEELKYAKSRLTEEEYERRLEALLLQLAEKNAKLRKK